MSRLLRFGLWFAPLALVLLTPFLMYAQDSTVTGCLKQGDEKSGYYVTAEDGKIYELMGKPSMFSEHVNHTVSVTGHDTKLPEAKEAKIEPHEKTEAGSASYVDFQVANLKMVSDSCK